MNKTLTKFRCSSADWFGSENFSLFIGVFLPGMFVACLTILNKIQYREHDKDERVVTLSYTVGLDQQQCQFVQTLAISNNHFLSVVFYSLEESVVLPIHKRAVMER
jgi:hypothetical protein